MPTLPTLHVEVAFVAGASTSTYLHLNDPTRGLVDTGTLAPDTITFDPTTGVFTDITAYVQSINARCNSTRQGPFVRNEAGTCSIELNNNDRRFDPTNLSGPYVSGGVSQVQPMRAVRVTADWAGTSYDIWRGFVDEWEIAYSGPRASVCTLNATDAFKVLSNYDRPASGSVGAGENSGARINRILDGVGWSSTDRMISTGDTTLQATTLDGNVLSELQLVTDTEIGQLSIDEGGRVVFRNRQATMEDTRSNTSQATFGDGAGELQYEDIELENDGSQLFNFWRITRAGGSEQTASDTSSQQTYLTFTYERSDLLMQTDAAALDYAQFGLYVAKSPELRFSTLTITPQRDPTNLYPQVLGREMGDRITINLHPPGGGTISRDVFLRCAEHAITPSTWKTIWTLESASKWSFLVFDNTTLGTLDSNALGY